MGRAPTSLWNQCQLGLNTQSRNRNVNGDKENNSKVIDVVMNPQFKLGFWTAIETVLEWKYILCGQ